MVEDNKQNSSDDQKKPVSDSPLTEKNNVIAAHHDQIYTPESSTASDDEPGKPEVNLTRSEWIAVFTAFVLVGQAAIYYWTFGEVGKTAQATREQVAATQNYLRASQRPWVAPVKSPQVDKNDYLRFDAYGTPRATVTFTVQNGGNSPAFNFVVNARLAYADIDRPRLVAATKAGHPLSIRELREILPECNPDTLEAMSICQAMVILPHQPFTTLRTVIPLRQTIPPIRDKTEIYLFGCIGYFDPLDPNLKQGAAHNNYFAFIERYRSFKGETWLRHDEGMIPGYFESVGQTTYGEPAADPNQKATPTPSPSPCQSPTPSPRRK